MSETGIQNAINSIIIPSIKLSCCDMFSGNWTKVGNEEVTGEVDNVHLHAQSTSPYFGLF